MHTIINIPYHGQCAPTCFICVHAYWVKMTLILAVTQHVESLGKLAGKLKIGKCKCAWVDMTETSSQINFKMRLLFCGESRLQFVFIISLNDVAWCWRAVCLSLFFFFVTVEYHILLVYSLQKWSTGSSNWRGDWLADVNWPKNKLWIRKKWW